MDSVSRGLNLGHLDTMSDAELAEYRAFYVDRVGFFHPAFEFWSETRPDVVKRYRLHAHAIGSSVVSIFGMLFYYATVGFEKGIYYEIRHLQNNGASKAQIAEMLALAFLQSGPRGAHHVATAGADYLRDFIDPEEPAVFPEGWVPDPMAFQIELDPRSPEITDHELEGIVNWYQRHLGEVPRHVEFLRRRHPATLKYWWIRFSNAFKGALPPQLAAYVLLQYNVARRHAPGIRQYATLARSLGVSPEWAMTAVAYGLAFDGGLDGAEVVEEAMADLLADW